MILHLLLKNTDKNRMIASLILLSKLWNYLLSLLISVASLLFQYPSLIFLLLSSYAMWLFDAFDTLNFYGVIQSFLKREIFILTFVVFKVLCKRFTDKVRTHSFIFLIKNNLLLRKRLCFCFWYFTINYSTRNPLPY